MNEKKRAREKGSVYFGALAWMHAIRASIACIRVRVSACVCKNSQTDHRLTQTERDTDIQRMGVFAFMRACACIHQMLAC